jgi:hypothetical protein
MKQPRPKPSFDMYSFGCIGYTVCVSHSNYVEILRYDPQVCTGFPCIFPGLGNVNFYHKVCNNIRPSFPPPDQCNGPEPSKRLWYMFITRCWQNMPEERPDVETIRRILEREASRRHGKAYIFKVKAYHDRKYVHAFGIWDLTIE